jgi:hypothetical protein
LFAFIAGSAALLLALGLSGRIRGSKPATLTAVTRGVAWERDGCISALVDFLSDKAKWRSRNAACPLDWKGELPGAASLIQWNATVTKAMESFGLEVLRGTEEIVDGRGRRPVHRLTLVAGRAGETLATITVEAPRPTQVSPVF